MIKLLFHPSKYKILSIISEPKLADLHSGIKGYAFTDWEKDEHTDYIIGVEVKTGRTIGMITCKPVTNRILEIHVFVMPQFWGTGYSKLLCQAVYQCYGIPSQYTTAVSGTPDACKHVQRLMEQAGFKRTHTIKNGIEYFGELMDYHYYELDISGDKDGV